MMHTYVFVLVETEGAALVDSDQMILNWAFCSYLMTRRYHRPCCGMLSQLGYNPR